MTASRSSIVCLEVTPYYHCITRVVRRAFLLGKDGKKNDFSHRREWVKDELARLGNIFAVTVCGYSLMDSHMRRASDLVMRRDGERSDRSRSVAQV